MPLVAGIRLGPYEIRELIGKGGMGEVYRARDTRLDRDVAIKVLPDHLANDPSALKRFEREAKAIATLSHQNILDIHEFDNHENLYFVVTEYLQGETLRAQIQRSPIPWKKAVEIAAAIAEGLHAAHSKGVIHRDLKPENIFLTSDGPVKILDFGLARLKPILSEKELTQAPTKSQETEAGVIRGTLPYMSPEQIRGTTLDARTDLFSFGCVLYEMLKGKRAFTGETAADTMSAILKEEPPVLDGVPLELDALIRRCLQKNPQQRITSAAELASELKTISNLEKNERPRKSRERTTKTWLIPAVMAIVLSIAFAVWLLRKPIKPITSKIESIAVLPLTNLSGDPSQEYFSDGITEAFINELAQIEGIRVISRTSVMQYKGIRKPLAEIGRTLKVDAILEGSVLQAGNRIEITANLLEPKTERRLWSKTYERDLQDIIGLRKEIARAIVREIHLTITPEQEHRLSEAQHVDPDVYRYYLRGNFQMNNQIGDVAFKGAITDYKKAVGIDANYAPAWAGLAVAYTMLGGWNSTIPPQEVYFKAREASLKALELDDSLAEAHIAMAVIKRLFEWDWAGAEYEFKRGIRLNPGASYAWVEYSNFLTSMGRYQESIEMAKQAVERDPLSPNTYNELGFVYLLAGFHKEAFVELQKAWELDPESNFTLISQAYYYSMLGMNKELVQTCQKALSIDAVKNVPSWLGWIGVHYAQAGYRVEALKVLNDLNTRAQKENIPAHARALIYIHVGDTDRAFQLLEESYENHEQELVFLKIHPHYDQIRDDPRFKSLLEKMHFP